MPEPCILSFYPRHVCLANNLIAVWNVLRIDLVSIGDVEKTLPEAGDQPERLKCLSTMVTDDPAKDTGFEVINDGPYPDFIFF